MIIVANTIIEKSCYKWLENCHIYQLFRKKIRFNLRIGNVDIHNLLDLIRKEKNDDPFLLDVGSGGRTLTDNTIRLDISRQGNIDIIGDGCNLPLKSDIFDGVIITDVMQYVSNPFECAKEIYRVLRTGGYVYAAEPFLHPDIDQDNFRYTVNGLKAVFSQFEVVRAGFGRGPSSAFLPLLVYYLAVVFCFNSRILYLLLLYLFGMLFWPFKYLDKIVGRYSHIPERIYTNSHFIGKKVRG